MCDNIIYQNYAYCRIIHIWSFLYLLNLSNWSPLISIYILFILHILHNILFLIKKIYLTNKSLGILFFDIFLIIFHNIKNNKIQLKINLLFFIIYFIFIKYYFKICPIKLHTKYLLKDDQLHENETYFQYKKRIWKLFFINK